MKRKGIYAITRKHNQIDIKIDIDDTEEFTIRLTKKDLLNINNGINLLGEFKLDGGSSFGTKKKAR